MEKENTDKIPRNKIMLDEYYTKEIDEFMHTQCTSDLFNGEILISDVPYKYRGKSEYLYAHKYARTIEADEKRHDQYWKIASLLEQDMIESDKEKDEAKFAELRFAHDMLFNFPTRFFP